MQPRLLIVDDEPAILFALCSYLERREYEIDTAESFEDAKAVLAAKDFDAVLTDLRLSGRHGSETEGLDVIRLVRQTMPQARTLLLTAYGSPQIEAEAAALGVDIYLQKPLPLSELDRLLHEMLVPASAM